MCYVAQIQISVAVSSPYAVYEGPTLNDAPELSGQLLTLLGGNGTADISALVLSATSGTYNLTFALRQQDGSRTSYVSAAALTVLVQTSCASMLMRCTLLLAQRHASGLSKRITMHLSSRQRTEASALFTTCLILSITAARST